MIDPKDIKINIGLWSVTLHALRQGDFTDEDVQYIESTKGRNGFEHRAAVALYTLIDHDNIEGDVDRLRAVLKAALVWRNSSMISPADAVTMADHLASYYADWQTVIEEHLIDHYNNLPYTWLNQDAIDLLKTAIPRDTDIFVELHDTEGVWVFANPDM